MLSKVVELIVSGKEREIHLNNQFINKINIYRYTDERKGMILSKVIKLIVNGSKGN